MSQLLEQINAEQERIEKESMNNCYAEIMKIKEVLLNINQEVFDLNKSFFKDVIDTTTRMFISDKMLRLKDMHDFIYSNPTLKGNLKEQVWLRFVEIYKINHESELPFKFDHDKDPLTEDVTIGYLIDQLMESFKDEL